MKYCLKAIDIVSVYKKISMSAEKYMCAYMCKPTNTQACMCTPRHMCTSTFKQASEHLYMISEWYGMNWLDGQLSPRSTTPSVAMEPVPSDFRILFQRSLLKHFTSNSHDHRL